MSRGHRGSAGGRPFLESVPWYGGPSYMSDPGASGEMLIRSLADPTGGSPILDALEPETP